MEKLPMNRLSRLSVSGFKSIRAVKDLELGSLNVLIGPNGAGKSNLLSLLRMLGALADGRLSRWVAQEGGANMLLHHGRKRTPEIALEVSFHDGQRDVTYRVTLGGAPPDTFFLDGEEMTWTKPDGVGGAALPQGAPYAVALSVLTNSSDAHELALVLRQLTHYHFHDTSAEAPIRQRSAIDDNRSLRDNGGNLAAFLYLLRRTSPRHYDSIRDTVRLVTPFFDDFVLEPDALDPKTIQLEWRERGSDMPFFAHHLSDGTLRFIAVATALLQPDPPDVFSLDEPELGLHPYAITLLASLVRSISRSRQVILATQSVTLLDELAEPDEVIVVERKGSERDGSESSFRRLDPEALRGWLEEYTLGELWKKNVLGGRP